MSGLLAQETPMNPMSQAMPAPWAPLTIKRRGTNSTTRTLPTPPMNTISLPPITISPAPISTPASTTTIFTPASTTNLSPAPTPTSSTTISTAPTPVFTAATPTAPALVPTAATPTAPAPVPTTTIPTPEEKPTLAWNHLTHPNGPNTAPVLEPQGNEKPDTLIHPTSDVMKCRSYKRLRKNAPPPLVTFASSKDGPVALPAKPGAAPYSLPPDHFAALHTPMAAATNSDVATEVASVPSDDADYDSSLTLVGGSSKSGLNKSFPSIFYVFGLLKQSTDAPDEFRALAQQFLVLVGQIADIIETFPKPEDKAYLIQYEVARLGVTFVSDVLRSGINMIYETKRPHQIAAKLPGTLTMAQTLFDSLQHFFAFAAPEAGKESSPGSGSDGDSLLSCDTAPSTKSRKFWKLGSTTKSLKSKISIFTFRNKSSATLSEDVPCPRVLEIDETDKPYLPRQSAIYFPSDPLFPKFDVEMPMPSGEAAAVKVDAKGEVKAGTLFALVNILTSHGGTTSPEFTSAFFLGFRFFSTPLQFFNELMKRYEHPIPPEDRNLAQKRVVEREETLVRTRVMKVVVEWLAVHWDPEEDEEILDRMVVFVDIVAEGGLFAKETVDRLRKEVERRVNGDHGVPKHRPRLICPVKSPVFDSSGFGFPGRGDYLKGETYDHLMRFNSPVGREAIAKQITAKVSEVFHSIKPEDAVMYWKVRSEENGQEKKEKKPGKMTHEEKEKEKKIRRQSMKEAKKMYQAMLDIEQALTMWVSQTILDPSMRDQRIDLIVFWTEVATICLNHRNFSSANSIFNGIYRLCVSRMKETSLRVPAECKYKLRHLDEFYSGHGNYRHFRKAINAGETEPTIPLIAPLLRDIITAKSLPNTTKLKGDPEERKGDYTLINLCGYKIMDKTIRCLDNCLPYGLPKEIDFQDWFNHHLEPFYKALAADEAEAEAGISIGKKRTHVERVNDQFDGLSEIHEPFDNYLMVRNPWDFVLEEEVNKNSKGEGETVYRVTTLDFSVQPGTPSVDKRKAQFIGSLIRSFKKPKYHHDFQDMKNVRV